MHYLQKQTFFCGFHLMVSNPLWYPSATDYLCDLALSLCAYVADVPSEESTSVFRFRRDGLRRCRFASVARACRGPGGTVVASLCRTGRRRPATVLRSNTLQQQPYGRRRHSATASCSSSLAELRRRTPPQNSAAAPPRQDSATAPRGSRILRQQSHGRRLAAAATPQRLRPTPATARCGTCRPPFRCRPRSSAWRRPRLRSR